MNKINIQYHKIDENEFILGSFEDKLCLLDYKNRKNRTTIDNRLQKGFNADYVNQDNDVLKETRKQLKEYLSKKRKTFDIPIITTGTDFQKTVWNALLTIPYGKTLTYLELAKKINNEKAVRAVANANNANAISIIIPCHRIIGSNAKLVGYAGGLELKEILLSLESQS